MENKHKKKETMILICGSGVVAGDIWFFSSVFFLTCKATDLYSLYFLPIISSSLCLGTSLFSILSRIHLVYFLNFTLFARYFQWHPSQNFFPLYLINIFFLSYIWLFFRHMPMVFLYSVNLMYYILYVITYVNSLEPWFDSFLSFHDVKIYVH